MAEDNNKNSKQTEATKNAFVNAAKMHGGPLGAGVNLANKTKLGNAVLNKGAEAFNKQNPVAGRLAGALNKGNSDLINNKKNDSKSNPAQAQESSKSSTGAGGGLGSLLNNKSKSKTSGNTSDEQLNGDGEVSGDFAAFVGRILKKHWPKVAAISAGALLFLIIIIAVYLIVASIAGGVIEFFGDIGDALVGFFKPDEQELIEKYYDELDKVQEDLRNRYNVCIDVNLITATLTVDLDAAEYADNIDNPPKGDVSTGEDEGASSEVEETEKDYKKMTKEVGLLGSMQIKRKIYGHDQEILDTDCRSYEEGAKEELVTDENLARLVPDDFWDSFIKNFFLTDEKKREKYVSTNADLVSRHDLNSFQRFFTKKINEEKNYEYYIYSPAYHEECDENGANCQLVCNKNALPSYEEIPTLSIGDLKTMDESVYYWNLVNSFIPNYYERYLPASGEARDKAIKKIAEKIYLLYNDLGPSTNCVTTQEYICRNDEGGNYFAGETSNNSGTVAPIAANQSDFFNKISDAAINGMSSSGIMASITMAQAALESSWGKSGLSTNYSNYYGMTAGGCASGSPSANRGTVLKPGEGGNSCTGNAYWNGTIVAACNKSGGDCQWYRVYDNFENSTKDHSRLLSNGRYSDCNSYSTPKEQIQCIKGHGYATDSGYVNKILNMIDKYNLSDYDIGEWNGTVPEEPSTPQYTEDICVHTGSESVAIGDWRNWKQCDKPWGPQKIGGSTICGVGCAATSVSILIAKSGTYTTLGANFNPGTFVQEHKKHGGFYGDNIKWDVTDVAPNFRLVGRYFGGITVSQVANYVNSGHYVILNVKHGGHFVAVDYVSGNKIHIIDPGYNRTIIPGDYTLSEIVGYVVYRKVD